MADYEFNWLVNLLNGIRLGVPRERLDWAGIEAVMAQYHNSPEPNRKEIARAIADIIWKYANSDWRVLADAIYLAYVLDIPEAEDAVAAVDPTRVVEEWRSAVERQRAIYLASLAGRSRT